MIIPQLRFALLTAIFACAAALMPIVAATETIGQEQAKKWRRPATPPADAPAEKVRVPASAQNAAEAKRKEAINSWTLGLAAGRIEGAPLQFAGELARAMDDGDNLRVLPIVTETPNTLK